MINFKKETNMYDLFVDNDVVTTRELLELGFTNKDLTRLIEAGKIRRVKRGFYEVANVYKMFYYYKYLSGSRIKKYDRGAQVIDKCIELDPNNGLYRAVKLMNRVFHQDWEESLEQISFLVKNGDNDKYRREHNFWLYLMSFNIELPDDLKKYLSSLKVTDMYVLDDDERYVDKELQNEVRTLAFDKKIQHAIDLLRKSPEYGNKNVAKRITMGLLIGVRKSYQKRQEEVYKLVNAGEYEKAIRVIEEEKEFHGISNFDGYILLILKDLKRMIDDKTLPIIKSYDCTSCFSSIENANYKKALGLFQEQKQVTSKTMKLLLERVVEEENKLVENNKLFDKINDLLLKQDVDGAFNNLIYYLNTLGTSEYLAIFSCFIKLDLISDDKSFPITKRELELMKEGSYQLDVTTFLQDYYYALQYREFDKAKIYLELISRVKNITGEVFDIYDLRRSYNRNMEDDLFSKTDLSTIGTNTIKSINPVLENHSLVMFEVMSDEEMEKIKDEVSSNINLETIYIKDEEDRKRLVLRYRDSCFIDVKSCLREADFYYKNDFYDEAIEMYKELLSAFDMPNSFNYRRLGLCYYKRGKEDDYERAIDCLTIADYISRGEREIFDTGPLINKLKRTTFYDGVSKDYISSYNSGDKPIQYKKS